MTPIPKRADHLPSATDAAEPIDLSHAQAAAEPASPPEPEEQWLEPSDSPDLGRTSGGRQVLAVALSILAALWLAYCAWAAGRSIAGQPLSSPMVAQWLALSAGPLALLGLLWLMFGRTRRKESERFTQSVIAMRSEAQSLEGLMQVLSRRMNDSRAELTTMAQRLMQLGDDATGKFANIAEGLDSSSERLKRHGDALDRAAESARNDMAVLLHDLPLAEDSARTLSEQLRSIGSHSAAQADLLERQIVELADHSRKTDRTLEEAADRLAARLAAIESAGSAATERVGKADSSLSATLDSLLDRTSLTLEQIRTGIGTQSAAVAALVDQASVGIGMAGADASEALAANVDRANVSLASLSQLVAAQDRASQQMIAEIDRGLTLIDQRFSELAERGDQRANRFLESLTRARAELDSIAAEADSQNSAIGSVAGRTTELRESINRLTDDIRDQLGTAIGQAQGGTDRLAEAAASVRPEIAWIRDAAVEASQQISATGDKVAEQQDRFATLLATVDEGVGDAHSKLSNLASKLAEVEREAASLSGETAPTLVSALVQVKDAAAHAAERAREAIESIIPASANKLSDATRAALECAIREGIEDRLREVESVAARAVESAREASDRLTQQMISIGQSAAALEQHIEETREETREKDSEAFARRVSLLIDSMNSAAIDVGKILADEIDDKAWGAYLKGNRGVFTSRAVRLIGGSETRSIRVHYDSDIEFQRSVNRYVHDFEAMLRRVVAEREGGIIAVTLMSSDTGKLYAALANAIDKRR